MGENITRDIPLLPMSRRKNKCTSHDQLTPCSKFSLRLRNAFSYKGVDIINGEYPPGVFLKGSQIFGQKNKGRNILLLGGGHY